MKTEGKEKSVMKKVSKTARGLGLYEASHWGAIALAAVIVTALEKIGLEYAGIFTVLFILNTIMTGGVIFINSKTETDFTLMENLRGFISWATKKCFLLGAGAEIIVFFTVLIWEGSDRFIIFFEKYFTSRASKIFTFLLASCCSMAIWTYVYMGIATGFWDLIGKLYH